MRRFPSHAAALARWLAAVTAACASPRSARRRPARWLVTTAALPLVPAPRCTPPLPRGGSSLQLLLLLVRRFASHAAAPARWLVTTAALPLVLVPLCTPPLPRDGSSLQPLLLLVRRFASHAAALARGLVAAAAAAARASLHFRTPPLTRGGSPRQPLLLLVRRFASHATAFIRLLIAATAAPAHASLTNTAPQLRWLAQSLQSPVVPSDRYVQPASAQLRLLDKLVSHELACMLVAAAFSFGVASEKWQRPSTRSSAVVAASRIAWRPIRAPLPPALRRQGGSKWGLKCGGSEWVAGTSSHSEVASPAVTTASAWADPHWLRR